MEDLFYTRYLDNLKVYMHERPDKKAIILLGYIQRDFIRFYRKGELSLGFEYIKSNIERNIDLVKILTPAQITSQMHSFVDDLAHEGIQNHVEIYPFLELQQKYHRLLQKEPVEDYAQWIKKIIYEFGSLMVIDNLSFSCRLESTLDIIYYINANIYHKLTVKDVLIHANQYCNPSKAQRNFSDETHMSIGEFISVQKMRTARSLLETTDQPIQDIAKKLKFYDLNDFSKQFKRKIGMSPLTYRKTCQVNNL
ncbi:helix-turn-helix transcriptional regulator [Companilactobacillus nuruki]|uniref:AraC family transcriptional regulator n=1 Tax=Companilactobacillus nuruki TaxID=1993540 RepID=A0A2N7AT23_9LACO|nr:response regulator transcription factor [Companilactobacillus nuruki]PMD68834.1 AraC family transcriptional regulator [Companilactobacillus nuruki]